MQGFVGDSSSDREHGPPPTPEDLFRKAAAPVLEDVWPLERSLLTSGVSRSFAGLPAASAEAFADAVAAVERFLMPFDCWSMLDYGFYEDGGSRPKLSNIDTQEKAEAFIGLLDSTVGNTPGTVVPHDLSDVLEHVRRVG